MNSAYLVFIAFFIAFSFLFFLAFFYYLFFRFVLPIFFYGAIFAKTTDDVMEKMVKLAGIQPSDKAVDVGSGDGRLVIALAKAGAEAHGYEINPFLVWLSRMNIKKAGFEEKAFIHWKNFWSEDFSKFDVITIYQISYIMSTIEKKMEKELRPGARVISNYFTFTKWPHLKKEEGVYLYKK